MKKTQLAPGGNTVLELKSAKNIWALLLLKSSTSDGRPIKDKAHELQVEGWRKAVQFDPSGSVLFTLTALTEVAVLSIQLLLLQDGGERATIMKTTQRHTHTHARTKICFRLL